MNSLFADFAKTSIIKHSETICGDFCTVVRENAVTAVLSDGLGSGVKANILATLTSKILSTLIAEKLPLEECVRTVASTLPMCSERKIAYATFTVLQAENDEVYLIQYDNPDAVLLRNGKSVDYRKDVHFYGEKTIFESRFKVHDGDIIVLMSDGVTNAGMGKNGSSGWKHEDVVSFLEGWWSAEACPKRICGWLCDAADDLNGGSADDDTTVMAVKFHKRRTANLLIGPPQDPTEDKEVLSRFFKNGGTHIICGGTTAKMAAQFLSKPLKPITGSETERVPAVSRLEGADLVTEGYLTLCEAVKLAHGYVSCEPYTLSAAKACDGASLLCRELFERATDVNIFFGTSQNEANAAASINIESKLSNAKRLCELLEEQGKNVHMDIY